LVFSPTNHLLVVAHRAIVTIARSHFSKDILVAIRAGATTYASGASRRCKIRIDTLIAICTRKS